jgi:hypothetical protein
MLNMNIEFTKIRPNKAKSAKGFTVVFTPPAGVDYIDASGKKTHVGTELYQAPLRHVLYPDSKDLRSLTSTEAAEILGDISRAMAFLGQPAEIFQE